MNIHHGIKRLTLLSIVFCSISAEANNISLNSNTYSANVGETIEVTITYDTTDFAIFGGGFDIIYDAATLRFESYTQADSLGVGYHQNLSVFQGSLDSPGNYIGAFLGTFDLHNGIFNAGEVGTFTFTVLGYGGDGGCSAALCLNPTILPQGQFNSIDNQDVTDEMFADALTVAEVVPVPVPSAIWFLISGIGTLLASRLTPKCTVPAP